MCHTGSSRKTNDWINPIRDGLETLTDESALVIRGEWTVVITLDEPQPPVGLTTRVNDLRSLIGQANQLSRWHREWFNRLDVITSQCSTPRRWWLHQHPRQRRGLLDVVGKASNFLFGTATEGEIADIHTLIHNLKDTQQRIISDISGFTTVINHTYDEIQTNRDHLNSITIRLSSLTYDIQTKVQTFHDQLRLQFRRNEIEFMINELERVATRYEQAHLAWVRRKEHLEAGRLTESLLPPTILKDILSSAAQPNSQPVDPLQWYYEYVSVFPVWNSERVVYRARLPLVARTKWHHVVFRRWPVPFGTWQSTLELPAGVLRNTETGKLDISPSCHGAHPRVCHPGLLSHATHYPCLTGLLNSQPFYSDDCVVTISRRAPLDEVVPEPAGQYTVMTNGTKLTLLCTGEDAVPIDLPAGVFRIQLSHPCRLEGSSWSLGSIYHRTVNLTIKPLPETVNINGSFTSLLNVTKFNVGLFHNLSLLGPVERLQLPVAALRQPWPLVKNKGVSMVHLFFLLLLIPLVVTVTVVMRVYRRRHCKKSGNPQEDDGSTERTVPLHIRIDPGMAEA